MDQLKGEYRSLAKKSLYARDFLKQNSHIKEPKKKSALRDDDINDLLNPNREKKIRGANDSDAGLRSPMN